MMNSSSYFYDDEDNLLLCFVIKVIITHKVVIYSTMVFTTIAIAESDGFHDMVYLITKLLI